MKVHHHQGQRK